MPYIVGFYIIIYHNAVMFSVNCHYPNLLFYYFYITTGQFWNIPILVEPFTGSIRSSASTDNLYQVTIQHPNERREFTAWLYPLTWEHRREYCLYAGNQQAGSVYEVVSPNDPVIEGTYKDYLVDTAYGIDFAFAQFDEGRCNSVVIG